MRQAHRGFARIDAIVAVGCCLLLVAIASAVFGQSPGGHMGAHPKTLRDASQLRAIHQSLTIFAREFDGTFTLPGLIDRLPHNGVEQPGRGEEDQAQNTTANLHSAMIMQNYYLPDLLISPVERSPHVKVMPNDEYNFELYNPAPDVDCYWDTGFKADLAGESNVSYANLLLFGARKGQWRATMNAKFAVLGNRGPKDGKSDPDSCTCGPHGNWAGNVVFNDTGVEFLTTTRSPHPFKNAARDEKPDNLFAFDDGMSGSDVILSFTRAINKDGATLQWD